MSADNFCCELRDLLRKYSVTLGVDIDGDTHGITENFVMIGPDKKETILNHHTAYLDGADLSEVCEERNASLKDSIGMCDVMGEAAFVGDRVRFLCSLDNKERTGTISRNQYKHSFIDVDGVEFHICDLVRGEILSDDVL